MRPSMQFYPGDWQRDAALRSCSVGARGLWIEMICLMHQAEPYGHLVVNGKPIALDTLARIVGCTAAECRRWVTELTDSGVLSIADGVIFSRRMVKDEHNRKVRAAGGKLGGNPALMGTFEVIEDDARKVNHKVNHTHNHPDNDDANHAPTIALTPSSSSSSSFKNTPPNPPGSVPDPGCVPDAPPGFLAFWTAWPSHKRKADKLRCLRRWIADGCEARTEEIVGKVRAWTVSEDWTKDGANFVPAPLVWLSQQRYDAPPPTNTAPEGVTYAHGQARIGRFVA